MSEDKQSVLIGDGQNSLSGPKVKRFGLETGLGRRRYIKGVRFAAEGLGKVLLVALVIPAIGFGVSMAILSHLNSEAGADGLPTVQINCQQIAGMNNVGADLQSDCEEVAHNVRLQRASLVSAAIGISIPIFYWLASIFVGQDQKRVAAIIPLVLRISIGLIAVMVLLQGAVLTYAAFVVETFVVGRVHFLLIGAIALGALSAGVQLIGAAVKISGTHRMNADGKVLTPADAPRFFEYVRSLATKLGATPPQNIIVGLDARFYVTSCDVHVRPSKTDLRGETLYVSAPLSRILSQAEFVSVLGHELGHFRGDDTTYDMRITPVYVGLADAIGAVASSVGKGASGIVQWPAIVILSYMYEVFVTKEAAICRDWEYKADQAGAEAGSALSLATALVKHSLCAGVWNYARKRNIVRLNEGKVDENLSEIFRDYIKYDTDYESLGEVIRITLEKSIPHPTDSHPPVSMRLKKLGVEASSISKSLLLVPKRAAVELIDDYEKIEREITRAEHNLMLVNGVAKLPKQKWTSSNLPDVAYILAARMIAADGAADARKVAAAEVIGRQLFDDFDNVRFRGYCNGNLRRLLKDPFLSDWIGRLLEPEETELVIKFLRDISIADGAASAKDEALLQKIEKGLRSSAANTEES